mmetsp:Transcript_40123/g.94572  ORF Transcript_40123/g.94572 Transcript_40123/m.94572 type:complete len:148 (-) Transcript_40123:400-843(-)
MEGIQELMAQVLKGQGDMQMDITEIKAMLADLQTGAPSELKPVLDFGLWLLGKSSHFVGRAVLFPRIDAWATDPAGSPVLIVVGPPGASKSALLTRLVLHDGGAATVAHARVVAHHVCSADKLEWLSPHALLAQHRNPAAPQARRVQ